MADHCRPLDKTMVDTSASQPINPAPRTPHLLLRRQRSQAAAAVLGRRARRRPAAAPQRAAALALQLPLPRFAC